MSRSVLDEQIAFFLEALAAGKGYSANTIRAYRHDLQEFAGYAAGTMDPTFGEKKRSVPIEAIDSLTVRG